MNISFKHALLLACINMLILNCASMHKRPLVDAPVDVIIVGAGMAGLTAAKELRKANLSFLVLEAQNRIGGRAVSDHQFSTPIDLGACWLHGVETNPLVPIVDKMGFSRVDTDLEGPIYLGSRWANKNELEICNDKSDNFERVLIKNLDSEKDPSASQFLEGGFCSDLIASNWGPLENASELDQVSSKAAVLFSTGNDDIIRESMGTFVARYGADVPVRLNSVVDEIHYGENGVRVHLSTGENYFAKRVLVTTSHGVLLSGKIRFFPSLPKWKIDAIKTVPMGLMNKIILEFKTDIFDTTPNNSWVLWDSPDKRNMAFLIKPYNTSIAIGFVGGDDAKLLEKNDDEALMKTKHALRQMYGARVDDEMQKYTITHHGLDPWSMGSYSYVTPGALYAYLEILRPVQDRVFFAGEGSARPEFNGAIHGAYTSALEASMSLILSIERSQALNNQ